MLRTIRDTYRYFRDRRATSEAPTPEAPRNSIISGHVTGGEKYRNGISASGVPLTIDHYTSRINARNAMHRSPQAKSLVDRFADTVVDTGLRLKPTPIASILKLDPEFVETWAEDVAPRFHLWAKSKKSSRDRVNNFYQNQRLYEIFQQRDNDIFPRLYYSSDTDLVNPLQVGFVDPNQIRGTQYTSSYAQLPIDDGITRDSAGRETGYRVWNYDKDMKFTETTIPAVGPKSGRVFMLHGFNPEYVGQGRGYSRIAHALQEFEELTTFGASHIRKAINQATLWAFTESGDENPAANPISALNAGPVREYGANPTPATDAQNVTPESVAPVVNWHRSDVTVDSPGSVFIGNLPGKQKIHPFGQTAPADSYDKFVDAFFWYLCASLGMSTEVALMKFNANYSASRGALILFWRVAQIWRDEMIADFLDPVYEMWLSEEIAAGRIQCPGWSDPRLRAAWLCCEWSGSTMPNIDPEKDANAHKEYVALAAETLDDVSLGYNGSSGKSNRAKLARQLTELPIPPWGDNKTQTPEGKALNKITQILNEMRG